MSSRNTTQETRYAYGFFFVPRSGLSVSLNDSRGPMIRKRSSSQRLRLRLRNGSKSGPLMRKNKMRRSRSGVLLLPPTNPTLFFSNLIEGSLFPHLIFCSNFQLEALFSGCWVEEYCCRCLGVFLSSSSFYLIRGFWLFSSSHSSNDVISSRVKKQATPWLPGLPAYCMTSAIAKKLM